MTLSSVSLNNEKYVSPFGSEALQKQNLAPINSPKDLQNDCFIKKHKGKSNSSIVINTIITGLAALGLFLYKKDIAKAMGKVITKIRTFIS